MATVRFIEHDGKRIDITEAQELIERRCDLCGEFVGPEPDTAAGIIVEVRGQGSISRAVDYHPEHRQAAMAKVAADLVVALFP